jgi:beta-glucosidase-like glycosyl hydrolase
MNSQNNIGRLIMPALRLDREEIGVVREEALRLLDAIAPCGFLLFGGRVDEVRALTAELRTRAGRPLLFASDMERGAGQQVAGLTRLPTPMAIAAAPRAEALACLAGQKTAVEALSVGINLLFAPICDVNTNPANPIINVRSFSDDPEVVARLARHWIYGARAAGALTSAKHFPGHGAPAEDSHIELSVGPSDREEFERIHLAPFRAAIAAGVDSIMVAHMTAPAIDASGLPATLSPVLINGLLRRELGYRGLVITDALIMSGLGRTETEAGRMALAAGCDILLYPGDPIALCRFLEETNLDPAPSLRRIEAAFGIDPAERIAASCLTLVSGKIETPSFFRIIHDDERSYPAPFREACRAAGWVECAEQVPEGAPLVTAIYAFPGAWRGRLRPLPEVLASIPSRSGVVSFGDPYLLADFANAAYALAAYDDHPATQRAVQRLLASPASPPGRLPVRVIS